MTCPHSNSSDTTQRAGATVLGYHRFVCHDCCRRFNGRTGSLFSELQPPTDIVVNAVLGPLRDVADLLLLRGFAATHETTRE